MNNKNGMKIVFEESIKRIEEDILDFTQLKQRIARLFDFPKIKSFKVLYQVKEKADQEIRNNEEFQDKIKNHASTSIPKFKVVLEKNSIEDLMESIEICDSVVIDNNSINVVSEGTNCDKVEMKDQKLEAKVEQNDKGCNVNFETDTKIKVETKNQSSEAKEEKVEMKDEMTQSTSNLVKNEVNDYIMEEKNLLKAGLNVLSESDQILLGHIEQLIDKKFSELQLRVFKRIDEVVVKKSQECAYLGKNNFKEEEVNNQDLEEKNFENISNQMYCDLCVSKYMNTRFVCVLCQSFNLCSKCEANHNHPTIKFKECNSRSNLHTKQEVYNLLKRFEKEDFPKKEVGFVNELRNSISGSTNYSAQLAVYVHNFKEVRVMPNYKFFIPLEIVNKCKNTIPSNTTIVVRNMFDLKIKPQNLNRDIKTKESLQFDLLCESGSKPNIYNLEIFLFNEFVDLKCDILHVKVIVNEDKEEQELNSFFVNHKMLMFIPKNQKIQLQKIVSERISDKDLYVIYGIMERNNWDIESAIDNLTMDI